MTHSPGIYGVMQPQEGVNYWKYRERFAGFTPSPQRARKEFVANDCCLLPAKFRDGQPRTGREASRLKTGNRELITRLLDRRLQLPA